MKAAVLGLAALLAAAVAGPARAGKGARKKPPAAKKTNAVTRYSLPMSLASVVRSSLPNRLPRVGRCTGPG